MHGGFEGRKRARSPQKVEVLSPEENRKWINGNFAPRDWTASSRGNYSKSDILNKGDTGQGVWLVQEEAWNENGTERRKHKVIT